MSSNRIHISMRLSPLLAAALLVLSAGPSLATEPMAFKGTPLARTTFAGPVNLTVGGTEFETEGSVDFAMITVDLGAPASSGWHHHPGIVLVDVISGSLVEYDKTCGSVIHEAGTSFVESGDEPTLIRNESTDTAAVVYVTFIVPTETAKDGLRVDDANPGCTES